LQRLRHQYPGRIGDLRNAVESAVASFKATGFVMCDGFFHPDVLAVGAPALDKEGRAAYVVTCGGPSLKPKFMRDDVGPRIARLAHKITVALAGRA
jgi:DNA-binding IclR family transcriptional regulator